MSRTHRWAVPLLAAAAAACDGGGGGGGTGPDLNAPALMQIATGDAQHGLPGETLPVPLTVRVTRADGTPAAGVAVRFIAAAGAVDVVAPTTTDEGLAFAWYRMPDDPSGELAVRAEATGLPPVTFRAGRMPNEQTDLVFTRDRGPVHVLAYNPFVQGGHTEAFRASFADSLLIRPFQDPRAYHEVVGFAAGRPPAMARVSWSVRRDSVQLVFPPMVTVPLTVWVVKAPFETLGPQSARLVDSATAAWSRGGIAFDARIVDATGFANAEEFQGIDVEPCQSRLPELIGWDAGRINVYYVGGIYHPESGIRGQGVYCGGERIVLAANNTRSPWLLGHEIGHAFGLGHEREGNLMDAFGRGRHVTFGQIFRAHYDRQSSLVQLLVPYSRDQVRDCGITWDTWQLTARCLPTTYDF